MQREIYLHVSVPRNYLQEEHISKLQRPGPREQRHQVAAHTSPPNLHVDTIAHRNHFICESQHTL